MIKIRLSAALVGLTVCCLSACLPASSDSGANPAKPALAENPGISAKTAAAQEFEFGGERTEFGQAPSVSHGPLAPKIAEAIDVAFGENLKSGRWGEDQFEALREIAESEDLRTAWIIADLMRIVQDPTLSALLAVAATELMGVQLDPASPWHLTSDYLIAWDVPAPPGYLDVKRDIYTLVLPAWAPLFVPGEIDWRHVSWGGVRIDDRAFDTTDEPCNCIPAADNPEVTDAAGAAWLGDDDVVFGIEVNGAYRAYPRQIMEVREMVNDTLGGRDLGIPYCTLCGSAQAYFTDQMPDGVERPVLRTSGLLIRSNKVMYDLNTFSIFDTFRGNAVTGSLANRGIVLKQTGVVTTTWGQWKSAHPETSVLAEKLAMGRDFDFRNNRDANGPIFPIGDVDPRLPVQEDILGVVTQTGVPIAFRIETALEALARGDTITFEEIRLVLDAGGVRAVNAEGKDLGGHQAFWFAWSQFYPETQLWTPAESK